MSVTQSVLCFGDSLTYGARPDAELRHAHADRWPSVLAKGLGPGVDVIAEGLGGRCSAFDPFTASADRNGTRVLPTLLDSHAPLDLVIVMLGTNDIWNAERSPGLAAKGTRELLRLIRAHDYRSAGTVPKVLVVTPPRACTPEAGDLPGSVIEGIAALGPLQREVAKDFGASWFDAGAVAQPSPIDGVHLDAENTRAIGRALVPVVADLLKE